MKRSYYRRRGIEILTSTRRLPVTGRIAAGRPIEAIVHSDELDVLGVMKPGKEYFALEVRGNSMIEDHIRDGDYVIVENRKTARDGEMVIALLGGERATLKKLFREGGGKIRLQPANNRMKPIYVDQDDVRVQGVVIGVLRKY